MMLWIDDGQIGRRIYDSHLHELSDEFVGSSGLKAALAGSISHLLGCSQCPSNFQSISIPKKLVPSNLTRL